MYMKEVSEGTKEEPRQSGSSSDREVSLQPQKTPSYQALASLLPLDCMETFNMPASPGMCLGKSHILHF